LVVASLAASSEAAASSSPSTAGSPSASQVAFAGQSYHLHFSKNNIYIEKQHIYIGKILGGKDSLSIRNHSTSFPLLINHYNGPRPSLGTLRGTAPAYFWSRKEHPTCRFRESNPVSGLVLVLGTGVVENGSSHINKLVKLMCKLKMGTGLVVPASAD